MPVLAAAKSSDTVQKYEFENGSTSGGKIYNEGWKGNTEEDGSGEDFDLTNASGGFSYLIKRGYNCQPKGYRRRSRSLRDEDFLL